MCATLHCSEECAGRGRATAVVNCRPCKQSGAFIVHPQCPHDSCIYNQCGPFNSAGDSPAQQLSSGPRRSQSMPARWAGAVKPGCRRWPCRAPHPCAHLSSSLSSHTFSLLSTLARHTRGNGVPWAAQRRPAAAHWLGGSAASGCSARRQQGWCGQQAVGRRHGGGGRRRAARQPFSGAAYRKTQFLSLLMYDCC